MKHLRLWFLFLGILTSFASFSFAQETGPLAPPSRNDPALYLGGTLGGNSSFIFANPSFQQIPHWGGTLGVTVHLENSRYTGIHASLLYTLRGWSEYRPAVGENATSMQFSRYIHYIELPIQTHLYYPFGGFRIGIKLGPQIGIMLGHQGRAIDTERFEETDQLRHTAPLIGKFAWGISGGPSLSIDFKRHRIALDALFYMGFNDLISTKISDYYSRFGEMMIAVNLSYLFRLY